MLFSTAAGRTFLTCECALLFAALPLFLCLHPARGEVALSLWGATAYAAYTLHHMPGFSWREEWKGRALSRRDLVIIAARFAVSILGIIGLTYFDDPARLFSFPLQRPGVWLIVMMLYPLLSALPQEFLFRSFFFRRYGALFPHEGAMVAASAVAFAFGHIVFHNWITPILTLVCGLFLAWSYGRHGSLKKAALEHALYGDMVFTVGLGVYFVLGHV